MLRVLQRLTIYQSQTSIKKPRTSINKPQISKPQTSKPQTSKPRTSKPRTSITSEPNRGLEQCIAELKDFAPSIPWGQLYGALSSNGEVLELAWKDANVVLFMTTVHNGLETLVNRERRRPAATSTGARQTVKIFGSSARKILPIPLFIDQYNHYMNGVDRADQARSYYTTQRRHHQTWKPLWHFLLDTVASNCFKLSSYSTPGQIKRSSHRRFQADLIDQLLQRALENCPQPQPPLVCKRTILRDHIELVDPSEYYEARLPGKKGYCKACQAAGRQGQAVQPTRKNYTNLSRESLRPIAGSNVQARRRRTASTTYGCSICKVHICKQSKNPLCWQQHIDAIEH